MSLPFLSAEQIEAFILVLLRVSAIVVTIPVISDKSVPARFKAASIDDYCLNYFSRCSASNSQPANYHVLIFMYRMAGEVMIGLIIGFAGRLVFAGIQLAGDMIGFQMGLSIANVIDPMTSEQVSTITELQYLIAMLVFLAVDAHHIFFSAIVQSYSILNPLTFHFSGQLMQAIFDFSQGDVCDRRETGSPAYGSNVFYQCRPGNYCADCAADEYFYCRVSPANSSRAYFSGFNSAHVC